MNNTFSLKSASSDFNQRQKNVFDQLKVLENNRTNTLPHEEIMETDQQSDNKRSQRSYTKHFRGKESIFKKPQNPVPKNYVNRIPDFKKHPHKWTRYSLDDVREEDISDKGNTKAALSFLKELENRKSDGEVDSEGKDNKLPTKIVFKRHTSSFTKPKEENPESLKVSFRSSKIVMPEYVIGQKAKKEKRNRNIKQGIGKQLKLDHLLEEDEVE